MYAAVEHYGFSSLYSPDRATTISSNRNFTITITITTEDQRRQSQVQALRRNLQLGNLEPFRSGRGGPHANKGRNAHCLYMFGLVDVVGWETFGKVIQSYHDGTYTPTKRYTHDRAKGQTAMNANAHGFFDRLARFHDLARQDPQLARNIPAAGRNLTGEQALRSLPDRGQLLDKYFTFPNTPVTGQR